MNLEESSAGSLGEETAETRKGASGKLRLLQKAQFISTDVLENTNRAPACFVGYWLFSLRANTRVSLAEVS